VREAIRLQPGWRELLGAWTPEIAPGAPAVRERWRTLATCNRRAATRLLYTQLFL
jgi:hypothetical protein